MSFKYVVVDNTTHFSDPRQMITYECSYTDGDQVITAQEALERKKKGLVVTYPKQSSSYHYYIYKNESGEWSIHPGKTLDICGSFSKITRINKHACGVVILADLDTSYPDKSLLLLLSSLIKGLCITYSIPNKRVLPRRYFEKDTTAPGLLFNVKRFVKEYLSKEAL